MQTERVEIISPSQKGESYLVETVSTETFRESFLSQDDAISSLKGRELPMLIKGGMVGGAGIASIIASYYVHESNLEPYYINRMTTGALDIAGFGGLCYTYFKGILPSFRLSRQIVAVKDNTVMQTDLNKDQFTVGTETNANSKKA